MELFPLYCSYWWSRFCFSSPGTAMYKWGVSPLLSPPLYSLDGRATSTSAPCFCTHRGTSATAASPRLACSASSPWLEVLALAYSCMFAGTARARTIATSCMALRAWPDASAWGFRLGALTWWMLFPLFELSSHTWEVLHRGKNTTDIYDNILLYCTCTCNLWLA